MAKAKPVLFETDMKCYICGKSEFLGTPFTFRDFIIHGTSAVNMMFMDYRGKRYFIGVKINDKPICRICVEILLGLEKYYNTLYPQLLENTEAIEIARTIVKNRQLAIEALEFIEKGKLFPLEFIEKVKKVMNNG